MIKTIRIATRKSPLALWQANFVANELQKIDPTLEIVLIPIITKGDLILDQSFSKIGGKGLFVSQLEEALLNDEADIAVHSMKDVPMNFAENLNLIAICARENPKDAFVSNQFKSFFDLPKNAIVGTSSLRRKCQIKMHRPDLQIKDLRGNIGTRLEKLDSGEFDAIILASAGLIRLNEKNRIRLFLETEDFLPAAGQGAIGIEAKSDNLELIELIRNLSHKETEFAVKAERKMVSCLDGSCQIPIGCFATIWQNLIRVRGFVGSENSQKTLYYEMQGNLNDAEKISEKLAQKLIDLGAKQLIQIKNDDH